ncbi:unnamed protein product, partial [Polarella glacialis]
EMASTMPGKGMMVLSALLSPWSCDADNVMSTLVMQARGPILAAEQSCDMCDSDPVEFLQASLHRGPEQESGGTHSRVKVRAAYVSRKTAEFEAMA